MLSHANRYAIKDGTRENFAGVFDDADRLLPRWRDLLVAHPNRFVFALDNVFANYWKRTHLRQMRLWRRTLAALPDSVAHAIAHGNSERLWKLAPRPGYGAARRPGARQPGPANNGGGRKRACTFEPVPASADNRFEIDVYSPDCMYKGTTLFADIDEEKNSRIVEVDYAGRVVWETTPSDYLDVPRRMQVMDVERLPSGNTLFNIKNYGAFEVTRDSRLVWRHEDNGISHDVDRLPNGNTIYVRGWVSKGEDLVREVDPSGKLIWSWNGLAQYDRPPFADNDDEGWMHANAVTRLANGNTVVSLRNLDRTVEVDPSGRVVHEVRYGRRIPIKLRAKVKKARGSDAVFRPHDPELQPNGNILVASPGTNRVIEMTNEGSMVRIVGKWPKNSDYRGLRDVNRLPNGNVLVVGYYRIFELSPDGRVVWSLHRKGVAPSGHTAEQGRADHNAGTNFYKAQRIAPDGTAYGG